MNKQNADTISGGVFLIGLGVLFLLDWFWPGILILVGVSSFINQWAKGNLTGGLTSLAIFGGIVLFLEVGITGSVILPAFLIFVGLLSLIKALRG